MEFNTDSKVPPARDSNSSGLSAQEIMYQASTHPRWF